jgi:hypothetical protein
MAKAITPTQAQAIKCAYADLKGALECFGRGAYSEHDWDAHRLTIEELENEFSFLTEPDNSVSTIAS